MKRLVYAALVCASLSLAGGARAQTPPPARSAELYEQLGQKEGIRHFTHRFLSIVLADERIKGKFEDANIDRLEGLLAEQFCDLSGGPCQYSGRDMGTAHRGMDINTAQFNALAEDLQIAMEEAGIRTAASNQLIAELAPMYHQVVTK